MTTTASLTLNQVTDWIANISDSTVDEVLVALQSRHDALHAERAQHATEGRHVIIQDVRPHYLDGLEGVIEVTDGETVALCLTAASTGRLRFSGQKRYEIGTEMNFLLEGVPASCCYEPSQTVSA